MNRNPISRRSMLKGGVFITGTAALGFNQLFGFNQVFAQGEGDDVQTILNLAATAETLACTHYHAALTAGSIDFTEEEIAYLRAALESELQHLEFLNANGGEALVSEFYTPLNVFTDRSVFAAVTEVAESAFVGAYLAATRRAAELGNPLLAATAAQVAGVEAQHLALIRDIGELLPNNISLIRTLFFNVSDAVPTLQPFLEGGDGFEGPSPFPGAEAIRTAVGDGGVESVQPFTDPSLFPAASTSNGAGSASGACTVTAGAQSVNIRSGAGLSFAVIGGLQSGQSANVVGQRMGEGFVWWQLENGGFVRSDAVRSTSNCSSVAEV